MPASGRHTNRGTSIDFSRYTRWPTCSGGKREALGAKPRHGSEDKSANLYHASVRTMRSLSCPLIGSSFIAPRYHNRDGRDHSEACEHSHGYGILETSSSKKKKRFNEKHPETVGQDVPTNRRGTPTFDTGSLREDPRRPDRRGAKCRHQRGNYRKCPCSYSTRARHTNKLCNIVRRRGLGWSSVNVFLSSHTHTKIDRAATCSVHKYPPWIHCAPKPSTYPPKDPTEYTYQSLCSIPESGRCAPRSPYDTDTTIERYIQTKDGTSPH